MPCAWRIHKSCSPRPKLYNSAQSFKLKIHLKCTHESFILRNFCGSTTVADLKGRIEVIAGIPTPLQHLTFLDQSYLVNEYPLSHFDIIPNAKISLRFFEPWEEIVAACLKENLEKLQQLLPLEKEDLTEWDQYSIYIAAFIIAHRGYSAILEELLKANVNLKRKLPSGRHPLLVSVRRGHIKCAEVMLGRRIRAHEWNHDRESLHDWEIQDRIQANYDRIKNMVHKTGEFTARMTKAQMCDSYLQPWLKGTLQRLYLADVLDGEPKKKNAPKETKKELKVSFKDDENVLVENGESLEVCKETKAPTQPPNPQCA